MTPDQEKIWREEFKDYCSGKIKEKNSSKFPMSFKEAGISQEECYLAARKKAQEEIDKIKASLTKEIEEYSDLLEKNYLSLELEIQKLKEEVDNSNEEYLTMFLNECGFDNSGCYDIEEVKRHFKQWIEVEKEAVCEKRDKLLEQAKLLITESYHYFTNNSDKLWSREWLKDYEEICENNKQ